MLIIKMTPRAKAYLVIRAVMFTLIGLALTFTAFGPFASSWAWTVPMLIVGAVLGLSAFKGSENQARLALMLAVVMGASWFGAFVAEGLTSRTFAISSLIAWGGVLAIDLVMLRKPLTTPFEELLTHHR